MDEKLEKPEKQNEPLKTEEQEMGEELDEATKHINDAVHGVNERISFIIAEGIERGLTQFLEMEGHEREKSLNTMIHAQKSELRRMRNQILDIVRERDMMFRVSDRLGARLKYCAKSFDEAASEIVEVVKVSANLQGKKPQVPTKPSLVQ